MRSVFCGILPFFCSYYIGLFTLSAILVVSFLVSSTTLQVKQVLTFAYLEGPQQCYRTPALTESASGTLEPILLTSVDSSPAILLYSVRIRYRGNLIWFFLLSTRARLFAYFRAAAPTQRVPSYCARIVQSSRLWKPLCYFCPLKNVVFFFAYFIVYPR